MTPLGLPGQQLKVTLRDELPCIDAKMVMVQEDQAEGLGLLY